MLLKFGTSGLRGLVSEMTPGQVRRYTAAFLRACETGGALCVGRDLRPSSPRIAGDVIAAVRDMGYRVIDCGALPTPALALEAAARGAGAMMVTGSHIPANRNGLKFYTTRGEITKADEVAILAALAGAEPGDVPKKPVLEANTNATARYLARYRQAFGGSALAGRRIGVYAHSSVGRDLLAEVLRSLGADVVELGRSETFIPVDTEAVDAATRSQIAAWVSVHALDALASTDGDADRPLLADETGTIVPGDIMGQITAEFLGADAVVTPVSSNSGVLAKGFARVVRTKIGSPYVIAAMEEAGGAVAGYEANGGFLLGFEAAGPCAPLAPLMTRDCMLPIIVPLVAAAGAPLSVRIADEPAIVTAADRLQDVPISSSQRLISGFLDRAQARADFLAGLGETEAALDLTDGLRMRLESGATLHIRPSGNAPELRIYVEAQDREKAGRLLENAMAQLRHI